MKKNIKKRVENAQTIKQQRKRGEGGGKLRTRERVGRKLKGMIVLKVRGRLSKVQRKMPEGERKR